MGDSGQGVSQPLGTDERGLGGQRHRKCVTISQRSPGWGRGAGEFCGAGLTKAAMAAPSREVTAAKETTRKMMMALTQRRKSWRLGVQGQREAEGRQHQPGVFQASQRLDPQVLGIPTWRYPWTQQKALERQKARESSHSSPGRDADGRRGTGIKMRSQGAGLGLDLHRGADLKDGVKAMFEYRTWGLDSLLTQEKERG